jgi:Novel toxin 21
MPYTFNIDLKQVKDQGVKDKSIEFLNISGKATTSQVKPLANSLGYTIKTNKRSKHGSVIWKNPNASNNMKYITYDQDSHIGGFWKAASSPENIDSKAGRTGTFNIDLSTRLGD